jgi:hypothetical protein
LTPCSQCEALAVVQEPSAHESEANEGYKRKARVRLNIFQPRRALFSVFAMFFLEQIEGSDPGLLLK